MYHKDLKIYTYPGGHVDQNDKNILETSIRETLEETGLIKLNQIKLKNNKLIPIDIDTHVIEYNERLNLPQHYHFDFRYLFTIDKIQNIKIDSSESVNYKWIDINEFKEDKNCVELIDKLNNYCE